MFFFLLLTLIMEGLSYELTQYTQNDYVGVSERFELVHHDERYVGNPIYHNFKFNRTHFGINFTWTFKMDFNNSLTLINQAYKFTSNEYRLFPIYFPSNLCHVLKANIFGMQNLYDCKEMFHCPIKKGRYSFCNWHADFSKFPPYLPKGRYRVNVQWMYFDELLMVTDWYVAIKDLPFVY